ncbi:MAG: DUF4114 domain-containing protein [Deltaproteobacteria bacterium]|nr:DUF4114 domain-containing protein [Deltaproteobacteria bacterium]
MSRSRKTRSAAALIAAAVLLVMAPRLGAVVNQIDGTIVPVQINTCPGDLIGCIQTGLNYGEGIVSGIPPTGQPNPVDAILDANTGPETFLVPEVAGSFVTVNFRLLQEGAGFENIFGWYNVGEPHIRYPAVPSCAYGQRSTYEAATESGGVISGEYTFSIDFAAEFSAGRYKGKQIGFYLVTPEGSYNRSNDRFDGVYVRNCATDPDDRGTLVSGGALDDDNVDEGDGHDDDNGFGRIYYTESKLNNDGNYVHYLVYRSKANPDHFYFGFEDLFRGGDNDYEDTMVKVEGLVPTCQPAAEVCNGVDDNCNGTADENLFRACASACGGGEEQCSFTNDNDPSNDWMGCTAPVPALFETCNGLDDDCNGEIDEGLVGSPCVSSEQCVGTTLCQSGGWVCDAPARTAEVCDGIDNDCNGTADDNVTRPCSSACGTGVESCNFSADGNAANDWAGCTAREPVAELCNGLDDDCNNAIDDGLGSSTCTAPSGCTGTRTCQGGRWVCDAPAPQAEICDGVDNNCNGQIDEDVTRSCTSICGTGMEACDPNNTGSWINCSAPQPVTEICNGKDDDCDGAIDNGVGTDGACQNGGCTGLRVCRDGGWLCDAPKPQPETCDGKDNDCNSLIDDGVLRACSSACGLGQEACVFSDDGDPSNDWHGCTAPPVAKEVCNGVDDDCDGGIDNNLPPGKQCTIGGCLGKERCTGGKWVCDAPIPGEEICDGLDNNCNGEIDEGLTRSCANDCGFGSEVCDFVDDNDDTNDWSGCTAQQPEDEVCDGVDNDCNGVVDDAAAGALLPGEGEPCDHSSGKTCLEGATKCVGGKITCVGAIPGFPEICDCKDNDCNGEVDEGDELCPPNTQCVACGCRVACGGGEFGCPQGFLCSEGYCLPNKCAGVTCQAPERCIDGECVDPCADVDCKAEEVCMGGFCVADNCYGMGCPVGEVCLQNACQKPPCAGVQCHEGDYCKDGVCKPSCGPALCGSGGARCEDGICLPNPCADITCNQGIRCIDGVCDTACNGKTCGEGRLCEKGACIDDPCVSVACPSGERCQQGQCISPLTFAGRRVDLLAAGGGGLSCGVATTSAGAKSMTPLLVLLGVFFLCRRRRQRRGGEVRR